MRILSFLNNEWIRDAINSLPFVGLSNMIISYVVTSVITYGLIKEEIRRQEPDAFKALIKAKSEKAIDVGIFTEDDQKLKDIRMSSDKGIADELCEGQVIYLKS